MLLTLAVALSLSTLPAIQPRASVPPAGVTVPMLDLGGRPMVEVRINGKGPYPLILDTGASFTGLDADLLDEVAPGTTVLDELRIGDAVFRKFQAARMPSLAGAFKGGTAPRGVLSAEAFPGQLVVFYYPAHTVRIKPGALPAADDQRIFEYGQNDELPLVPVTVAGHTYRIHLDTGSPSGVTLPMKTAAELPLVAPPVEIGRARTVAGEFPVQRATVKGTIAVGGYALDTADVRFSDVRPGPEPAPGNLGAEVLRGFVVTVDAKNRRIRFERPA